MPNNRIFRGDAAAVAQVVKITPASVEIGDTFEITINGKTISYESTDGTVADVVDGIVAAWNESTIPEAAEITAAAVDSDDDDESDYLTLTADEPGVPFKVTTSTVNSSGGNVSVETTVAGEPGQNEVQKIELLGTYSGGTFTLSWNPGGGAETTGAIAYNASAATVQAALEALATPVPGDFLVTGSAGGPWYVHFKGTYAETDVALMTIDGSSLTGSAAVEIETTTEGSDFSNTIQYWVHKATQGNYTLRLYGESTADIAWNASAATVQAALEALGSIGAGNVAVYGGHRLTNLGGRTVYFVEFVGDLAGEYIPDLGSDEGTLGGGIAPLIERTPAPVATGGVSNQRVTIVDYHDAAGGDVIWNFNGNSAAIDFDTGISNISALQTALGNSPGISGSYYGRAGLFALKWSSTNTALLDTFSIDDSALTSGSASATKIQDEGLSGGANEVQEIFVTATGGTFTLTFDGQTTAAIAYNASAATVAAALEALSNITDVSVTGSGTPGDPWVVTFLDPGAENVAEMTGDGSSLTGGGGEITVSQTAAASVDEEQEITIGAAVTGGTFTLNYDGEETAAIAYDASAATVESALEALDGIDGVSVSGSAGGPWTVAFDVAPLAGTDVSELTADGSGLIGGSGDETLTLLTTQRSKGPNHFDDPDNWTGFRVPDSLDSVYFAGGSINCLYGTKLQTTFTADASTDTLTLDGGAGADFVLDQIVRVMNSGGGLPGGLSASTDYYVVAVDYDAGTMQVSATSGGAAVNISSAGTGTHYVAVKLAALVLHSRWSNAFLGLTERNENEYFEYRNRSLSIAADAITVGAGDGDGSPRMDIDTGPWQTAITLLSTGGSQESGLPAFRWKGTHASNSVLIVDGEFGASVYATETSVIDSFIQRAGFAMLENCTLASIDKTGGELLTDDATLAGAVNIRG